jgi:MFS family permease
MGVIGAYRRVLRNPALARLLIGEFVSSIGDWLYLVALLVVVYAEANDALALGIIGAARVLPYVLLSVPAGIAADRFDRRMILIVTDVARGLLMLVIAAAVILDAPVLVIVLLAIISTCFATFFSPAIGAFLPTLVRDESELGPANSAWASLDNLAFFVGPAFAALLLSLGEMEVAFLINAATFGFVAIVLWGLRPPVRDTAAADGIEAAGDHPPAPAESASFRARVRPIARPLVALGVINVTGGFAFGGIGVMTVILAVDVLGAGEPGTGLLNSAIGVGGLVGALLAGVLVLRRRLGPPLLAGSLLFGAALAALGVVGDLPVAMVAIAVVAGGALLVEIVTTTLFQRIVPDEIRGRTLGIMDTVSVIAYAVGAFIMPVVGATDPAPVLALSGLALVVAGVVGVLLLGHYAIVESSVGDARRSLADVALFAGLPPARLEQAMRAARLVPMRDGEVVIRQGDEADRFYLIVDGTVEVTQTADGGPARMLRRMGSGEFFGEIGLLSGVPRTATVTAVADGELVALDREPFLELVSAGPGLTYRLLDLHRGTSSAGA